MYDPAINTVDEDARRRFESAWIAGEPEPIERYLPPIESSRYSATLLELVVIDLEMSWKAGRGTRAEDYLARFPTLLAPELLPRLLQEEYSIRHQHGEKPVRAEYEERFPDMRWTAFDFETAAPAPRRNAPPTSVPHIPGLEIGEVLGRGGMGVVYKARQTNLDRAVAIKLIVAASPDLLVRFQNEAQAVAKLRHANVVQVHEVGEAQGQPYLVLEFVDGGTLAKKLGGAPQSARAAAEMIGCLARAVQAIHAEGLLHRDLKPGNVLVSKSGILKITDFGLTKRVDGPESSALTETGVILGTPSYMAPEQASGRNREVGTAADVYALGAILYEMLTGRPPFHGATPMETVMNVVSQEPVTPRRLQPRTPIDLETICLKCLEKEPARRYASASDLADDVDRFLANEPIRARPVGAVERGWRWCRRKPALASLVAVVALAVVGGGTAWLAWRNQEHQREIQISQEEHARKLEADEAARKKQEDDEQRRERRQISAKTNRTLALSELRAGRFDAARQFLRQAHENLVAEPPTVLSAEIAKQYDRVERLTTFYRLADRAERLAFLESDQRSLRTCDEGLRTLGVFDHEQTWWTKLPADDLRPEQAAKLVRDVDHQLTLLAALWIKEGQETSATDANQKALDVLKFGERYREANKLPPSIADRILEAYVYGSRFRLDKIRRLDDQEPQTASDCYFVGIALFWTSQVPGDWISQSVNLTFPLLGVKVSGEPKKSAERMLRQAVAEEPGHFWSHFWLGWCLLSQKNYEGAELAFTTCTTMRPEEGLAYAERARALAFRAKDAPAAEREALIRRVDADAERARRFTTNDWYVHQPLLHANWLLGRQKESLAAAGRMLDLITLPHLLQSRLRAEQESSLKEIYSLVDFADPVDAPEAASIMAMASVILKKDDDALRLANYTAKTQPDHPRVHVVRGIVHLRKKELPAAAKEFEAALAVAPNSFVARSALSRTLELTGKNEEALRGYESLLAFAETDGQRLGAYLGCYRNRKALGRHKEADKDLESARAIDPQAAESSKK